MLEIQKRECKESEGQENKKERVSFPTVYTVRPLSKSGHAARYV